VVKKPRTKSRSAKPIVKANGASDLQKRAESLSTRFKSETRRPIVIEFAGLPKAGKTSTIGQVQSFLRRCGFRVEVVIERASICPIRDKKHANFNVWTATTSLAQILEHTQLPGKADDPEVIILDRGLFDAVCWLSIAEGLARIRATERKAIEDFLLLDEWRRRISGVILMIASPSDALKREGGYLPVIGKGGSIMNPEVLTKFRAAILSTRDRLGKKFSIETIDTSNKTFAGKPEVGCRLAVEKIMSWIEQELDENILSMPKTLAQKFHNGKSCLNGRQATEIIAAFRQKGNFRPHAEVENDNKVVQALPIVIVRNKKGEILQLKRRERDEKNNLHEKVVIWAGGHVRDEDDHGKQPIVAGAIRELQEELRLFVEPKQLRLIGSVWSPMSPGTEGTWPLCLSGEQKLTMLVLR
jgi:hypothetical protein